MKAGLIYEIESIKPHREGHEYRVFWETMEQIELADRLGFDSVWTVEHHFLNEFSYCSAPEVFLACVSQRTRNIRIGHGVVVLPFNHPVRVAERIAVLDIMSNGRVEFGTGRATTMDELLGFGVRPEETRPRWAEAVEAIPRMWREDPFTMRGQYWTVDPPVSVIPKPIQKPHPPIWVASTNPDTFALAAERGLGVLCFTLGVELDEVKRRVQIYRDGIANAHPVGLTINNQVSMNIMGLFGDDPRETEEIAREAVLWYVRKGFELVSTVAHAASGNDSYKYLSSASRFDPAQITRDYYHFLKDNDLVAIGAPSEALRVARRYRETGADQILFFLQYGAIPHERIMRSIELLGSEVLPEIHSWETGGCVTPVASPTRASA
ncbi:MAG TPA: LLM class flavin-dependent oxidoreductase [Candidatus Binataceae bacterium]|nr:LLM class flavin-dependent oxidoreductase [Candidatus Binataceae bacterium]